MKNKLHHILAPTPAAAGDSEDFIREREMADDLVNDTPMQETEKHIHTLADEMVETLEEETGDEEQENDEINKDDEEIEL